MKLLRWWWIINDSFSCGRHFEYGLLQLIQWNPVGTLDYQPLFEGKEHRSISRSRLNKMFALRDDRWGVSGEAKGWGTRVPVASWGSNSLRSLRDSGAGEQAAEPPYSLAKPTREFNSTPHQSSHGFATRVHGSSLPKQKYSRAKSRQLRRLGFQERGRCLDGWYWNRYHSEDLCTQSHRYDGVRGKEREKKVKEGEEGAKKRLKIRRTTATRTEPGPWCWLCVDCRDGN